MSFFPKAKKYHLSVDIISFFTVILCVVLLSSFSNVCFLFLTIWENISGRQVVMSANLPPPRDGFSRMAQRGSLCAALPLLGPLIWVTVCALY